MGRVWSRYLNVVTMVTVSRDLQGHENVHMTISETRPKLQNERTSKIDLITTVAAHWLHLYFIFRASIGAVVSWVPQRHAFREHKTPAHS